MKREPGAVIESEIVFQQLTGNEGAETVTQHLEEQKPDELLPGSLCGDPLAGGGALRLGHGRLSVEDR